MSYILEALRKSERQRRASEEAPLVRLVESAPARPRSRWRIALLAASVITNIAVLAYLAGPLFQSGNDTSRATSSGGTPEKGAPSAPSANQQSADEVLSRPVEALAPTPALPASGEPAARRAPKARPAPAASMVKPSPIPRAARNVVRAPPALAKPDDHGPEAVPLAAGRAVRSDDSATPSAPTAAARRSPAVDPGDAAREGLPSPKINVYAYSSRNDGDRFVVISNRTYREGDRIDSGAVVRRIEEHAMTLEFAGQTYKVPRP